MNKLHPYQLFTGIKLEEARDELRQGLYRPPPVHCPLLCFHDRSVSHSLQQHINYKNGEKKKSYSGVDAIQICPGKSKLFRGISEEVFLNPLRNNCHTDCKKNLSISWSFAQFVSIAHNSFCAIFPFVKSLQICILILTFYDSLLWNICHDEHLVMENLALLLKTSIRPTCAETCFYNDLQCAKHTPCVHQKWTESLKLKLSNLILLRSHVQLVAQVLNIVHNNINVPPYIKLYTRPIKLEFIVFSCTRHD